MVDPATFITTRRQILYLPVLGSICMNDSLHNLGLLYNNQGKIQGGGDDVPAGAGKV